MKHFIFNEKGEGVHITLDELPRLISKIPIVNHERQLKGNVYDYEKPARILYLYVLYRFFVCIGPKHVSEYQDFFFSLSEGFKADNKVFIEMVPKKEPSI